MDQILHAEAPLLQREPGHQRGCLEESPAPAPAVHCQGLLLHHLVAQRRGHVSPKRYHAHASIGLVSIMEHLRTGRGHGRRHHQGPRLARGMQALPVDVVLAVELVQGDIPDLRLHGSHPLGTGLLVLLPHQREALVELVDLALPRHGRLLAAPLPVHFSSRLHAPGSERVQRDHRHQGQHSRETQAQVHGLEHSEVTLTNGLGIELLKRLAKEVRRLALPGVLAHLFRGGLQCV